MKASLNRWFSEKHRNELSNYAQYFLRDNADLLDESTLHYINNLIKSRRNLLCRVKIIFDRRTVSDNKNAERSFKVRTMLGIL